MNIPEWLDWSDENIAAHEKKARVYKYIYGVKDIQVRYKEFERASVFVSKPYEVEGNIMEISLIADDKNHIVQSANNAMSNFDTTIEYYVSFKEYPRYDEWIPILPRGCTTVNEYLFLNGTKNAKLRFACDTSKEIIVYKNGVRIPDQHWSFCSDNSITIDKYFDKYAIYTVTYSPNPLISDPWNIEIGKEDREIVPYISPDGTEGEVFKNGTDRNGIITLSKTPFIDYERINTKDPNYHPIEVILENANIAGPNRTIYRTITKDTVPATRNITDYLTHSEVTLKAYDPTPSGNSMAYPYFEYIHDGRKLYFTETFNNSNIVSNMPINHGDAWIRVKYSYLKTQFRVKIILRNVSPTTKSITPSVNRYSVVFKVVR